MKFRANQHCLRTFRGFWVSNKIWVVKKLKSKNLTFFVHFFIIFFFLAKQKKFISRIINYFARVSFQFNSSCLVIWFFHLDKKWRKYKETFSIRNFRKLLLISDFFKSENGIIGFLFCTVCFVRLRKRCKIQIKNTQFSRKCLLQFKFPMGS